MVKVKIIAFTRLELTGGNQQIKKKIIQLVSRIKVVLLTALRGVSRIFSSKFCDSTKYSIRGARTKSRMKPQVLQKVAGNIFRARAAAEIDTHQ